MSRLPVAVQAGGKTDFIHVCHWVSGLSFTKTAPGGDFAARMRLDRDPALLPDLSKGDRVAILNPRTGIPLWMGYVEDTGADAAGFDLAVTGGYTLATDMRVPLIYADRALDEWERAPSSYSSSRVGSTTDPAGAIDGDMLIAQFQPGSPVQTNSAAAARYEGFRRAGMQFGTAKLMLTSGKNDTAYLAEMFWPGGSSTIGSASGITNATSPPLTRNQGGGAAHPAAGVSTIGLRLRRTGSAITVGDDKTYTLWYDLAVFGRRMDRFGTLLNGNMATTLTMPDGTGFGFIDIHGVWARPIIEDLIGRLLPGIDPDTAIVDVPDLEQNDYARLIQQLAYRDPVHAADVLGDLTLWEPELTWAIDAPLVLDGKHRGRWYMWDYDRPRYVITREHGFKPHVGQVDLANRLTGSWTDSAGRRHSAVATADVPELRDRVRDAEDIALPEGISLARSAQYVVDAALEALVNRPRSGTATIYAPILDEHRGIIVEPCEIEVGYTALLAETGEVLRVVEVDYDDEAQAAKVTLGELEQTLDQRAQGVAHVRAFTGGRRRA